MNSNDNNNSNNNNAVMIAAAGLIVSSIAINKRIQNKPSLFEVDEKKKDTKPCGCI